MLLCEQDRSRRKIVPHPAITALHTREEKMTLLLVVGPHGVKVAIDDDGR